jgi:putative nucleotidyltransferase with HDIG domain
MNARRRRLKFTSRITDARNVFVAWLARAVGWLSPSTQFVVGFILLSAFTTLLLARSRSQMPADYHEGEIVTASVVAPTDIQIEDEAATKAARAQNPAAAPVLMQLRRNQIVARVGEPVTPKMLAEFDAIRRYSKRERLPQHFIGLFFLVAALYWGAWKFIEHRSLTSSGLVLSRGRAFTLVASAVVVETILIRFGVVMAEGVAFFRGSPWNDELIWTLAIPFASATLLVAILMDVQLAVTTGLITALFAGLLAPNNGVLVACFSMVSSSAAIYGTGRYRERQSVTLAGLLVAAVNAFAALAVILAAQKPLTIGAIALAVGCGVIGGLLTTIFTAGGLPINESLFGILTDVKLLELSNADLPVLGQLALRAPGTNQHSHAVGQLVEDAARVIDANPLLARIGALYHDIGKLAAPQMFVENQSGENPHDRLRPTNSARIIVSHVTYGVKLAHEIGLPQKIVDFIPQHHGTRTLHYFLRKAQAQAIHGDEVDEAEFRYPGPKPQFKESAIMMLADSCEAAARSLARPDPENIRTIVNKIFEAIVNDGQLDECNLTLRELTAIRESITTSLVAIYHARIDYPGFNPPPTGITSALPPLSGADVDSEERGVTYATPADIPISKGGEVEDEAVTSDR